jgi:PhzF family phenazine biosynthesis protein
MKIKTFIVDAFTNEPFKGNPAGVCLLNNPIEADTMQAIASEINLSETAFILQQQGYFTIRYFTPTVEIDFCGHATLAASKIVLDYLQQPSATFATQHNLQLSAVIEADYITMKFPLYDTVAFTESHHWYNEFYALLNIFGIEDTVAIRHSDHLKMLLVEVTDNDVIKAIQPNYVKALSITNRLNNFIVTARSSEPEYDFYSRCFCPWIGINEDPVTGAAHTILAKYWGDKLNKSELAAYQSSKRGGFMNLKILASDQLEVRSNARIILDGWLEI